MEKLLEWARDTIEEPFSFLSFALGAFLLLLGVTTGIEIPIVNALVPDGQYRWVALVLGVILIITAFITRYWLLGAVGRSDFLQELESIPDELTRSFTARRATITENQKQLLTFLERAAFQELMSRETIQARFHKFAEAELYYRLEHLYLLGFLEKQRVGQDELGYDLYSYHLSAAYRRELGNRTIPRVKSITYY